MQLVDKQYDTCISSGTILKVLIDNYTSLKIPLLIGSVPIGIYVECRFWFIATSIVDTTMYVIYISVHLVFLPEPAYRGPDNITYFRGPNLEVSSRSETTRVKYIINSLRNIRSPCHQWIKIFQKQLFTLLLIHHIWSTECIEYGDIFLMTERFLFLNRRS